MLGPFKDLYTTKQSRGELPDYYTEKIERTVRTKILLYYLDDYGHILQDDTWRRYCNRELNTTACNESDFHDYLLTCDSEEFLSALQILFTAGLESYDGNIRNGLMQFINKINKIFQIEKVGYEISIISNLNQTDVPILIVPVDSKYLYDETIQKTRVLLNNFEFDGALNEFDKALDDLRFEKFEDCIHKSGKSYESTLKTILDKKQISYNKEDNIFSLVTKVRDACKLGDPSLNTLFERFWSALGQGPNVIRNFEGIGHGQGANIKNYEKSYANFVLHLTGTYIVFLLERYEEVK